MLAWLRNRRQQESCTGVNSKIAKASNLCSSGVHSDTQTRAIHLIFKWSKLVKDYLLNSKGFKSLLMWWIVCPFDETYSLAWLKPRCFHVSKFLQVKCILLPVPLRFSTKSRRADMRSVQTFEPICFEGIHRNNIATGTSNHPKLKMSIFLVKQVHASFSILLAIKVLNPHKSFLSPLCFPTVSPARPSAGSIQRLASECWAWLQNNGGFHLENRWCSMVHGQSFFCFSSTCLLIQHR